MSGATLRDCLDAALRDEEIFGDEGPCPTSFEDGPSDRLLVISGGNGGGKSLLCRYLAQAAQAEGRVEVMRIGMGLRTGSGMERSFVFGREDKDSTGRISGRVVIAGAEAARSRERPHWLIFDEPDVGMSEGCQAGAGAFLARFAADLPDLTTALVVVSHSRRLVAPILEAGALSVRVGDDLRPVRDWIRDGEPAMSVEAFENLQDVASERKQAVQAILNARQDPEAVAEARLVTRLLRM